MFYKLVQINQQDGKLGALYIYNIAMQEQLRILILGGSSFMGKELVGRVTREHSNVQIHLVNRGKKYWNNDVYRDNPKAKYFYGDRNEHKEMHKAIEYLNQKVGVSATNPWAAVIDFTSYKWRDLQSVVKALRNKVQIYIFISTDSIYNNTAFNGKPIVEEEYPVEQMYGQQRGTRVTDKYVMQDKLKCEVYLSRRKPVPYLNLRLPDVLGPFDNTNRYWSLLKWIKESARYPLELNHKDRDSKLSFVSSKDVAQLIWQLIRDRQQVRKYSSYNLGFGELVTYRELVEMMAKSLQSSLTPKYAYTDKEESNGLYPSTNYTHLDCELAKNQLNWSPTPLSLCISETTAFFETTAPKYASELRDAEKQFKKKVQDHD